MPLSVLIWLPALCGVLGAILPSGLLADRGRESASSGEGRRGLIWSVPGVLALVGSFGALGLAIGYIAAFKAGTAGLQHVTDVVWISELGIHYKLGLSGLNVFLVGLTTLLFAAAVVAANVRVEAQAFERPRLFYFHFMLAESAVLGAFLAQDLAL